MKSKKFKCLLSLLLAVILVLGSIVPAGAVTKQKVKLNKTKATVYVGKTVKLKVSGTKQKIKWSSSNKKVAIVNSAGKVTGKKTGTAKITAKYGKKSLSCKITVKKVQISKTSIRLVKGKSYTLKVNGASGKIKWTSQNKKIAKVNAKGKVTAIKAGTTKIIAKVGKKSYTCKVTVINKSKPATVVPTATPKPTATPVPAKTYTRGEWIQALMQKVGANLDVELDQSNYKFADTADSPYGKAAEIANRYGIIPTTAASDDVPLFRPNDPADREFAAVTAVKAMGFEISEENRPDCTDSSAIQYPGEVYIALNQGMLSLENNYFYPSRTVTSTEAQQIFNVVAKLKASAQIDTSKESTVEYANNVVKTELESKEDYAVSSNADGTYNVIIGQAENAQNISAGKVFILPATESTGTDIALKADSVSVDANGNTVVSAVQPSDISEVYTSIDYSGDAVADVAHVTTPDGITVSYGDSTSAAGSSTEEFSADAAGAGLPGKLKFDLGKGHKFNDQVTAKGSVSITVPDVTCKVDMDFLPVKVNEVVFSITDKIEYEGGIYVTGVKSSQTIQHGSGTIEQVGDSFELGRVPFKLGATGLSVDLVFSFYYTANGQFVLKYTIDTTQGYQYKDGQGRFLFDFDHQLTPVSIEGKASAGLKLSLTLAALSQFDLIGADFKIGPAANVSVKWHNDVNPQLICAEAKCYMSASVELDTETYVGKYLKEKKHYTLSYEFLKDNDDNPLRLSAHFENGEKVPTCTYGTGGIIGYVYSAENDEPINKASLTVLCDGQVNQTVYTNEKGYFSIDNLEAGDYTIRATATGYQQYNSASIQVNKKAKTYMEKIQMVSKTAQTPGSVVGSIVNAVNGDEKLAGHYIVRKGWSNTSGEIVLEGDTSGDYTISLNPGNYTISAQADGYTDGSVNVTVLAGQETTKDIALSPRDITVQGSGIRIILTWGETPEDLDSHLFGINSNDPDFFIHTWYDNEIEDRNDETIADLDWDDINSYGPETTTVHKVNAGDRFSYYVHDYTNGDATSSNALSTSGAKVQVIVDDSVQMTFAVPLNTGGTLWHVFDFDADSGQIIPVNTMGYSDMENEYEVPSAASAEDSQSTIDYDLWFRSLISDLPAKAQTAETIEEEFSSDASETIEEEFSSDSSITEESNFDDTQGEPVVEEPVTDPPETTEMIISDDIDNESDDIETEVVIEPEE